MKKLILLIVFFYCFIAQAQPYTSSLDPLSTDLQLRLPGSLNWENINAGVQWLQGIKPHYSCQYGLHIVSLKPGQECLLRSLGSTYLRLHFMEQIPEDSLPLVFGDSGSGLEVELKALAAYEFDMQPDKQDVIYSCPDLEVLRIVNPKSGKKELKIALFLSRLEPSPIPDLYRQCVETNSSTVRLSTLEQPGWENFIPVKAGKILNLELTGPLRLRLNQHLILNGAESSRLLPYKILCSLDGRSIRPIRQITSPLSSQITKINGRVQSLSQQEQAYIFIPKGRHNLELKCSRDLLLLVQAHDEYDFLLPHLNLDNYLQPLKNNYDIDFLYEKSLNLAFDNTNKGGGLLGSQIIKRTALYFPDILFLQRYSRLAEAAFTYYQDAYAQGTGKNFYFFTPKAGPVFAPQKLVVSANATQALLSSLSQGLFFQLSPQKKLGFNLPPRSADSKLRLVVSRPQSTAPIRLRLKMGEKYKQLLLDPQKINFTHNCTTGADFKISSAQAGLFLLQKNFAKYYYLDFSTQGGPFSLFKVPGPMLDTSYIELDLAQEVKDIEIFLPKGEQSLLCAVQVRVSRPFELDESSYLFELSQSKQSPLQLFKQGLTKPNSIPPDLKSHWQPLYRFLQTRKSLFAAGIGDKWESDCLRPISAKNIKSMQDLIYQAEQAQKEKQYARAIEIWAAMLRIGAGKGKYTALQGLDFCLSHTGENYLLDSILRYEYVYGDNYISRQAFKLLHKNIKSNNDIESLKTLYAFDFVNFNTDISLQKLSDIFISQGQYKLGLMSILLLAPEKRDENNLALAAFKQSWLQTYQKTKARLDPKQYNFWLAMDNLFAGQLELAKNHLALAGFQGQKVLQALVIGQDIASRLYTGENRPQAVEEWEKWQGSLPGPFIWQKADQLVDKSYSRLSIYSPPRDLTSRWYMAESRRPVKLQVWGPTRLKFQARPLHSDNSPLNGWIKVQGAGQETLIDVSNNKPVQGLELLSQPFQPGGLIEWEMQIEPGLHKINVQPLNCTLAINVYDQRPVYPLPILPRLSLATVNNALYQSPFLPIAKNGVWPWQSRLVILVDREEMTLSWSARQVQISVFRQTLGQSGIKTKLKLREKTGIFAASKHKKSSPLELARHLVYTAEQDPTQAVACEARLQALVHANPRLEALRTLLNRISDNMYWEPVHGLSSAGIYYEQILGWEPKNTPLRIRKALLPCIFPGEHILFRPGKLVMNMFNIDVSSLILRCSLGDFPWLPARAMQCWYQIDKGPVHYLSLTRSQPEQVLHLEIPAGEHIVSIGLDQRWSNQFLRIQVEDLDQACSSFSCTDPGWSVQNEMAYELATPTHPLLVEISGPAWVRIDRKHGAQFTSSWRYFDSGEHELKLEPAKGQTQALFRVFKRSAKLEQTKPSETREVEIKYALVKAHEIQLPALPEPRFTLIKDKVGLAAQQNGVWEFSSLLLSRRSVQEDRESDAEKFIQFQAVHRYFHKRFPAYFKTGVLSRIRQNGGPVLGLSEDILYMPRFLPFNFSLKASLFGQDPDSNDFWGNAQQWSGLLSTSILQRRNISPKLWHIPNLSLFVRYLSLDDTNNYSPDDIDQDVFSSYKRDHKHGFSLGDSLHWSPWLDSLFMTSLKLTTNEDFNAFRPDKIQAKLGWKQLWGPVQSEIGLRHAHYFQDNDRSNDNQRSFADFKLTWTKWTIKHDRWQVGVQGSIDFDSGHPSGGLFVNWLLDGSQELNDFRLSELDFKTLKTWAIPASNQIKIKPEFFILKESKP